MIFRKRLSPDKRAMKWLEALDAGGGNEVIPEIRKYPKTVIETRVPLLHVAILANQVEVAEALLQHGANPNHADQYGQHPILLAAEKTEGNAFVVLLIENGAAINVTDRHGASPLMYAARANHSKSVKSLLKAGADANHRDYEGDTVLMYAVASGNETIISSLLTAGAAPDQKNFDGLTALDKCPEGAVKDLLSAR